MMAVQLSISDATSLHLEPQSAVMSKTRILLLTDLNLFHDGLAAIIERQDDLELINHNGSAADAAALMPHLSPDIILLDLNLSGSDGVSVMREVLAAHSRAKIIVLTLNDDEALIAAAVRAGAVGYVHKESRAPDLLQALRNVAAGAIAIDPLVAQQVFSHYRRLLTEKTPSLNRELTARDLAILHYLSEGHSNREIGALLGLSEQTIKNTLSILYQKLGVINRAEAVMVAMRRNLLPS